MPGTLEVKPDNVVSSVSWNSPRSKSVSNPADFDNSLQKAWVEAVNKGYFRYKLKIEKSIILPGKWKFFIELNPERGSNRRKPQEFSSIREPFNPNLFNFTKIREEEILFKINMTSLDRSQSMESDDLLAINVSPICDGHCLIIPDVNKTYPQVLTHHGMVLGVGLLLMSSSPSFRVAFNSLLGFASVNHLHLHSLYIPQQMFLESVSLEPLAGPCFQLTSYPAQGFAFQCKADSDNDVQNLTRNVIILTNFLHERNVAHNVTMTRSKEKETSEDLTYVRVYVWARKPNIGFKVTTGINPAALELFGYFCFKDGDHFNNATEDSLSQILEELTTEPFESIRMEVKQLFSSSLS